MAVAKISAIRRFADNDQEPCCVLQGLYIGLPQPCLPFCFEAKRPGKGHMQ